MMGAKLATMKQGARTDLEPCANLRKVDKSQPDAAEACKVSRRSIQSAREVLDHGTEELIEAVEKGEVSVSAASVVARLPEEEQERVMSAGTEEVKRVAAEIRQKRSSDAARIYERATKQLASWYEKFAVLGEEDLHTIIEEVIGRHA